MTILFNPGFVALDGNGTPYAGAKLNFYATGTTTRQTTYNDADLADPSHANTNPVVADANGLFGPIYLDPTKVYKAVLTTSADVTIWTRDPIGGPSGIPVVTAYTASGTHTRTLGTVKALIEAWGGGGGGGGAVVAPTGSQVATGGGGGAGGYSRRLVTAADLGASIAVTIGAAGAGGLAGNNAGSNGGDTSVGSLCIGKGGSGGAGHPGTSLTAAAAGAGGVPGTGDESFVGEAGSIGTAYTQTTPSRGGSSTIGNGGAAGGGGASTTGGAATSGGYASGGGGGYAPNGTSNAAGGAGTGGFVRITEYIG